MSCFEVLDENSKVVVNDTFKTFVLTASGKPDVIFFGQGVFYYYGGSAGRMPAVAVWSVADSYTRLADVRWLNGRWEIRILTTNEIQDGNGKLANVMVYVYDIMYASTSTFGMQAFNEAGEVTFDALKKTMRTIKTNIPFTCPSRGVLIPNAPVQPAGKRYAWILGMPAVHGEYRYNSASTGTYQYNEDVFHGFIGMNANGQFMASYSSSYVATAEASFDGGKWDVPGTFAVLDVTNH